MSARGDADSIVRGLSDGVDAAASLPREGVRHAALRDLGSERMVHEYASLYRELVGSGRGRA